MVADEVRYVAATQFVLPFTGVVPLAMPAPVLVTAVWPLAVDPPFRMRPFFAAAEASLGVGGSVMVGVGEVDNLTLLAFFAQKEAAPFVLVVVDILADVVMSVGRGFEV